MVCYFYISVSNSVFLPQMSMSFLHFWLPVTSFLTVSKPSFLAARLFWLNLFRGFGIV